MGFGNECSRIYHHGAKCHYGTMPSQYNTIPEQCYPGVCHPGKFFWKKKLGIYPDECQEDLAYSTDELFCEKQCYITKFRNLS